MAPRDFNPREIEDAHRELIVAERMLRRAFHHGFIVGSIAGGAGVLAAILIWRLL
jgi:hypothetical protein